MLWFHREVQPSITSITAINYESTLRFRKSKVRLSSSASDCVFAEDISLYAGDQDVWFRFDDTRSSADYTRQFLLTPSGDFDSTILHPWKSS